MNSERWREIARLYDVANDVPPERRRAFLTEACAGDDRIREEVESLVSEDERESPLDRPLWATDQAARTRLDLGFTLGPYRVEALIGVGGMGEGYRARDTTLQREVALKVLPDAFVHDPERLARFTREAHVLASLNHPGIAAIYGLAQEGDVRALVLELVDGPSLADRIASGPLPVDESLSVGVQIAGAF